MAERKSEKGDLPSGWTRVGLQIPDALADELSRARERLPGQLSKLVGTAAVAVFVSLPEDVQLMLYRWAHSNELEPHQSSPEEALALLLEMMRRHVSQADQDRPLHALEIKVIENAAKVIGDRSPNEEMQRAVRAFNLPDYEREERERKELFAGFPEHSPLHEAPDGQQKAAPGGGNIKLMGKVKPIPVADVNGPTASETAKALVDHLKQPPLPNASTHRVTNILEPAEPKKKKGAA